MPEADAMISRRRVLRHAVPVAAATVLGGVAVAADRGNQTPILRRFIEYQRLVAAAAAYVVPSDLDEDEEMERLFFAPLDEIEGAVLTLPCTCAADFAAKVIVATFRGRALPDWETDPFWSEARGLTGWPQGLN